MEKFTVALLVNNHYGVLTRVASMYNRRGYNIDSLTVGQTENPAYSRMTIVSRGDEYVQSQAIKQLRKLSDVKMALIIESKEAISLEHLLIKIKINTSSNKDLTDLMLDYGAKIMDLAEEFIIVDLTAKAEIIDEFINKCIRFGILELARSGSIALSTNNDYVQTLEQIRK